MTYLELCKVTLTKSFHGIYRLNDYAFKSAFRDLKDGIITLLCIILSYTLNMLYFCTFPISSVIIYFIHKREAKKRESKSKTLRQARINRFVNQ